MENKYLHGYEVYDQFWVAAEGRLQLASANNTVDINALFVTPPGVSRVDTWAAQLGVQHLAASLARPNLGFPLIEYLWCYWMEEAKLFDIMDQICARYTGQTDDLSVIPELMRLDLSPLHQVAQGLWGYTEDMMKTKTIKRVSEYARQYGIRPVGRRGAAAGPARAGMGQENVSGFLRDFHKLLHACARYFREYDDNTITQDPRPVLNALKTLNFGLSEGFHNQYMFVTAKVRKELFVIQDILNQPEVQRFLGAKLMANYPAAWMGAADEVRRMMRCNHTPITEFYNLAHYGEIILLAVRIGPFDPIASGVAPAEQFALGLRDRIMQYIHSYHAVTGVDLASDAFNHGSVDATPPAAYLRAKDSQARGSLFRGRAAA